MPVACRERTPNGQIAEVVGKPQAAETIRVIVFYGGELAVCDVPRRCET